MKDDYYLHVFIAGYCIDGAEFEKIKNILLQNNSSVSGGDAIDLMIALNVTNNFTETDVNGKPVRDDNLIIELKVENNSFVSGENANGSMKLSKSGNNPKPAGNTTIFIKSLKLQNASSESSGNGTDLIQLLKRHHIEHNKDINYFAINCIIIFVVLSVASALLLCGIKNV